jgi:hypothetical protein
MLDLHGGLFFFFFFFCVFVLSWRALPLTCLSSPNEQARPTLVLELTHLVAH